MADNDVEDLTFYVEPDGTIFPDKDLPLEERKLKGFIWRGDERIITKDDIFDEDDNNIQLVRIRGIDNPIDIDAEEEERRNNPSDPVNNISEPKAIDPKTDNKKAKAK
jgi:hypothetical protein